MFENNIKNLQLNFNELVLSNVHELTREIRQEIQVINNGLDNIKLDYESQRDSKDWRKQLERNQMQLHQTNVEELIEHGNDLVRELNTRLHTNEIKTKELNQIRETHNWALNALTEYFQSIEPHASSSYARLDNMAHHLGVTDRFVGYRNNLTRYGSQPVNVNTIWADRKLPTSSTPDWKEWTRAFQHNTAREVPVEPKKSSSSMATTHPTETERPPTIRKRVTRSFNYSNDYNSQMIRAGRNPIYPGRSETLDRFVKPKPPSYTPSFAVAQPDYTCIGRPLARLVSKSSCSEYRDRYIFPDASTIERYPWLRP